jgi:hypothetical protein
MEVVLVVLFGAILVTVFVALPLGWGDWWNERHGSGQNHWRRLAVTAGLAAVTAQFILFVVLWTPIVRSPKALGKCAVAEVFFLLVMLPSVIVWKRKVKWLLLASAVVLPVLSFFVVLAEAAF